MLFFICAIEICLNIMNDINLSWWFLNPSTLFVLFVEMLEGILFYKELKYILKEKKLPCKLFWKFFISRTTRFEWFFLLFT